MRIHQPLRKNALAVLASVLVMGFVVGPSSVAVGQDPPEPAVLDEGLLVLELGDVDRLVRFDAAGQEVSVQSISTQGCHVSLATDTVLADIAPIPASSKVGLFDDGIGVFVKGSGQPCGRVDGPDEGLVFALAGDLATKEIAFAELDIEGKFDVIVNAELYRDGAKVGDAEPLMTGELSDSGPDSADGDNYRWIIDEGVLFDEVHFLVDASTPSGAFSLAGGADGTTPGSLGISGSAFALVETFDGIIPCGDDTFTTGDGIEEPQATFTRGDDDGKNPDQCSELIGFNLDSSVGESDQTVTFEFDEEEFPSWFGSFTWTPEPAVTPVPATQVDGADLMWCEGFDGIDAATGNPKPVLPAGQSWCLITQTSTLVGLDQIQVTQTIFGESDPNFIRPK